MSRPENQKEVTNKNIVTEDLLESDNFFQALSEMQERLEIKKREFQIDEDNAKVFASQLVVR